MKPATAYKVLFAISGLMSMMAASEIAIALFTEESLSCLSYTMVCLTIVNAALYFIIGLNLKIKAEIEESHQ